MSIQTDGSTTFKKINFEDAADRSLLEDFYRNVYIEAFDDENERESIENIIAQNELFAQRACNEKIAYCVIVAAKNGEAVGGMIADVFAGCGACALEFIAVAKDVRKLGIGDGLLGAFREWLEREYPEVRFDRLFFEVEDPLAMDGQYEACIERAAHWNKRGALRVDIEYLQPALAEDKDDVGHLLLCCFSKSEVNEVSRPLLHAFLTDFFHNAFNIPANKVEQRIAAMLPPESDTVALKNIGEDIAARAALVRSQLGDGLYEVATSKYNPLSLRIFSHFYANILSQAFSDPEELEPLDEYLSFFRDEGFSQRNYWYADVVTDGCSQPLAGIIYSFFPTLSATSVQFLAVSTQFRKSGLARKLVLGLAEKAMARRGFSSKYLFCEILSADQPNSEGARTFWHKLGSRAMDFSYEQAAIAGRHPLEIFQLCVAGAEDDEISTETVKQFLIEYAEKANLVGDASDIETLHTNLAALDGEKIKLIDL